MSYALAPYAGATFAGLATAPAAPPAGNLPITEFAIEFDPGAWTDLDPYRVSSSSRRGRNAESGAFETGRGFVTLRNETRIFDPEYAAGPYFGKLRPNRRVRWRANYGGGVYPIIVGYIDRITQPYKGPNDAVAEIAFSDRFKILNTQELAASVYAATVAASGPTSWWRLDAPSGSSVVLDSIAGGVGTVVGAPGFGTQGLVVRDPGTAVKFTNIADRIVLPASALPATSAWTIEFLFNGDPTTNNVILMDPYLNAAGQPAIQTLGAGSGVLTVDFWSPGPAAHTGAFKVADNTTHHVAIVGGAGIALRIWVDGIDRTASTSGFTVPFAADPLVVNGQASNANFTLDELAFYPTALSSTDIAAHNAAARTPWNGDLPGARINRILDAAGVSTAERDIDAGTTPLQSTSLDGTVLSYIQKVAETEIGSLFVDRSGNVRFIGRRAGQGEDPRYLTSAATLEDEPPAATAVPYTDVTFDVDQTGIVTRATVSREGSVAVTYQDTAAITEFGVVDFTADGLFHDSDLYSSDYAQWIVNSQKGPETKVGTVRTNPLRAPAVAFPALLALELGARVTLTRRPKVGAAITRDYRVEAIEHAAAGKTWGISLELSAFNQANNAPVFIWGVTKWGEHVWGL